MRIDMAMITAIPGGMISDSIALIVNSRSHDLFKPLHPVFDLAIIDRFHTFVPGWEIPKNKDENLTRHYGLITDEEWARRVAEALRPGPFLQAVLVTAASPGTKGDTDG